MSLALRSIDRQTMDRAHPHRKMPAFTNMNQDDCLSCPFESVFRNARHGTHKLNGPSSLYWIRVSSKGVSARGVACYCLNHRKLHYHYAQEVECASDRLDQDMHKAFSAWIRTGPSSSDGWMPITANTGEWAPGVIAIFETPGGTSCSDVRHSDSALVCARTGEVMDATPFYGIDPQWSGANSGKDPASKHMQMGPDDVGGGEADGCVIVEQDVFAPVMDDVAPKNLVLSARPKDRATSKCRKESSSIAEDIQNFVRATIQFGEVRRPVRMHMESELQIAHARDSYGLWRDCSWAPMRQLVCRMVHNTNTPATYDVPHDKRRELYYTQIILQVGKMLAFALKHNGGLCQQHTIKPKTDPIWHPTVVLTEKIVAGTLDIMSSSGSWYNSFDDGTKQQLLPCDTFLVGAIHAYRKWKEEDDERQPAAARTHLRRHKAPASSFPSLSKRETAEVSGVSTVGIGVQLSRFTEGCKLVHQGLDLVCLTATSGAGTRQKTAQLLIKELLRCVKWYDRHQSQNSEAVTSRMQGEKCMMIQGRTS